MHFIMLLGLTDRVTSSHNAKVVTTIVAAIGTDVYAEYVIQSKSFLVQQQNFSHAHALFMQEVAKLTKRHLHNVTSTQ